MTTPSTRLPTWATDATVSPPFIDAGLPVRVEPAEAEKAQGYIGGAAIAAATDNWRAGATCDWLNYLAPAGLQLRRELSGIRIFTYDVGQPIHQPFVCKHRGVWIIPGCLAPPTDNMAFVMSWPASLNYDQAFDLHRISENCYLPLGGKHAVSAASDGYWCVIGAIGNTATTDTRVSVVVGNGPPNEVVVAGSVTHCNKVFYGAGRWLLLPSQVGGWANGLPFYTATNPGGTWAYHAISGASVARSVLCCATSGAGFAIAFADSNLIAFSADGLSWHDVALPAGERPTGITWILNGLSVLVLCENGNVYRVASAGAVAAVSQIDEPVTFGSSVQPHEDPNFYGNLIASDNGSAVICLGHNPRIGSCYYRSLDCGQTWVKIRMTSALPFRSSSLTDDGGRPLGITYADGEFLATCYSWPLGDGLDCTRFEIWRSPKL